MLYIGFSSGMSGTYNNSTLAAKELAEKYPERKIYAVDSLCASLGHGLLVWDAVQKQKSGASIDELKQWLEENRGRLHHWFTVNDLNHLKRGGRLSATAALVGTMLGIKPVLQVNVKGCLAVVDKIRGRKQALDDLVTHMTKTCHDMDQMVFISHTDYEEGAEYVKEQVEQKLGGEANKNWFYGPGYWCAYRHWHGCTFLPRRGAHRVKRTADFRRAFRGVALYF